MLLDSLVGQDGAWEGKGEHYRRTVAWCARRTQTLDQDNALTIKVLPWALGIFGLPDEAEVIEGGKFAGIRTPAYVVGDLKANQTLEGEESTEIWYSPGLLAQAWEREKNGRVDKRTESAEALRQQSNAISGEYKQVKISGTRINQRYRRLDPEYVQVVLQRVSSS